MANEKKRLAAADRDPRLHSSIEDLQEKADRLLEKR